MISSIKAVSILYKFLNNSVLKTDTNKPNGELCKYERPEDSTKEDQVIHALGLNREPVQKGVLVLNIYVNNLNPLIVQGIGQGKNRPDTARLEYLADLVYSIFTDEGTEESEIWIDNNVGFEVTSDDVFSDSNNQHYISFRINFFTIK